MCSSIPRIKVSHNCKVAPFAITSLIFWPSDSRSTDEYTKAGGLHDNQYNDTQHDIKQHNNTLTLHNNIKNNDTHHNDTHHIRKKKKP